MGGEYLNYYTDIAFLVLSYIIDVSNYSSGPLKQFTQITIIDTSETAYRRKADVMQSVFILYSGSKCFKKA